MRRASVGRRARACVSLAPAWPIYIWGCWYRRNETRGGAKREWKDTANRKSAPQGRRAHRSEGGVEGDMESARNTEARSTTPHAVTLDASATRRSTTSATASRCPPPGQSEATPTWGHHTWPHGLTDWLREPDVRSAQSYWPLAETARARASHTQGASSRKRGQAAARSMTPQQRWSRSSSTSSCSLTSAPPELSGAVKSRSCCSSAAPSWRPSWCPSRPSSFALAPSWCPPRSAFAPTWCPSLSSCVPRA